MFYLKTRPFQVTFQSSGVAAATTLPREMSWIEQQWVAKPSTSPEGHDVKSRKNPCGAQAAHDMFFEHRCLDILQRTSLKYIEQCGVQRYSWCHPGDDGTIGAGSRSIER